MIQSTGLRPFNTQYMLIYYNSVTRGVRRLGATNALCTCPKKRVENHANSVEIHARPLFNTLKTP